MNFNVKQMTAKAVMLGSVVLPNMRIPAQGEIAAISGLVATVLATDGVAKEFGSNLAQALPAGLDNATNYAVNARTGAGKFVQDYERGVSTAMRTDREFQAMQREVLNRVPRHVEEASASAAFAAALLLARGRKRKLEQDKGGDSGQAR